MRVTLKDIAKATGLSTATVSLVLNHKKHRISEQTQQLVFETAKKMDYRPNQLAVGLITKRTNTIGVIVPDITNAFFAVLAQTIEGLCYEIGYSIILCCTNENPDKDVSYTQVLLDKNVDAIILTVSGDAVGHRADDCISLAQKAGLPLILLAREINNNSVPCIRGDYELGGFIATEHLLKLGHTKIGCITGPLGFSSAAQRFFGYIRALQQYQIPFDNSLVIEGNYHMDSGYDNFEKLYKRGVTAIFTGNDMMAYGVCKKAFELKINVPENVSVIGFDNNLFSEVLVPPITTIDYDIENIGKSAVECAINMIEHSSKDVNGRTFAPRIIERESTCVLHK